MKFNRENYELYVIDFLEGKLPEEDHIMFIKFLRDHPDINDEVKDIHNVQLQPGDEQFPGKQILKKNVRASYYQADFDNFCIAYLEGDLEYAERIDFEHWILKNPEKNHELELFRKVYLKADLNNIFSSKSGLKKRSIVQNRIRIIPILTTAAAAIVIFIIIFVRPADVINTVVISEDTNNNIKVTTEQVNAWTEEFQEQPSADQKLMTDDINYANIDPDMEHEAVSREKISIQPVSSLFAQVENQKLVRYDILQQPDTLENRKFDEYQTLGEYVNENILGNFFSLAESDKKEKMTLWNLASNSLEGLNSMTDGGYALDKETNRNGTLKRISLETPLLGISIPVKNKQPQ